MCSKLKLHLIAEYLLATKLVQGWFLDPLPPSCMLHLSQSSFTSEAGIAQLVSVQPFELEGYQFDPRHLIDVCFNILLFCVAVALNTRKTEH